MPDAGCPESLDDAETPVGPVELVDAVMPDGDDVFDSHPELPRDVDARLDGLDLQVVALDDVGVLVALEADAVPGAVDEELAIAGRVDDRPGRPVDVLSGDARSNRARSGSGCAGSWIR